MAIFVVEMLKKAWNKCQKLWDTRVYYPKIDLNDIELNHDKYEWEMIFCN